MRSLAPEGEIFLRRKVRWEGATLAVPVTFNLSNQDVEWPACVHVEVRNASRLAATFPFLAPVLDVWSGPLNPTKGRMESGILVERRFVSAAQRTLSLLEETGDSIARHLWDGSQALAQHIDHTISLDTASSPLPLLEYVLASATYRKLAVLELGCGCGTVGISLAQAVPDCDVLLTDLHEVRDLTEANIERMNAAIASKVAFFPLDWTQELPEKLQTRANDLIVVSECTYNTDTLQPLVSTLVSLIMRSPKAIIIVSTKTRHASEAIFFDMMKKANFIEHDRARVPLPGIPGTGYADGATDVGLYVFRGPDYQLSPSPRASRDDGDVPTSTPRRVAFKRSISHGS